MLGNVLPCPLARCRSLPIRRPNPNRPEKGPARHSRNARELPPPPSSRIHRRLSRRRLLRLQNPQADSQAWWYCLWTPALSDCSGWLLLLPPPPFFCFGSRGPTALPCCHGRHFH